MSTSKLEEFNLIYGDTTDMLAKDVHIQLYKPDREFYIDGDIIEGYLPNNLVKETDMICMRYSWYLRTAVDIEVYAKGRQCWYRCSVEQFNKIKNYLAEVH